jgi:4-carboxymuconolactone decarboxylase
MPSQVGAAAFESVNTFQPSEPRNVYRQAVIDLIFAQVWTRPGLTRRQRRWVSLTAAGMTGTPVGVTNHIFGALKSADITVAEMGEFLLHFACYAGWPAATLLDSVIEQVLDRIAAEGTLPPPERTFTALRDEPLEDLADTGRVTRAAVLGTYAVPVSRATPVTEVLVGGLEYGHIWSRPHLPRGDRRLITLTCLAVQGHEDGLRAHLAAALESADFDVAALREIALHAGLYAGVTVALKVDAAIDAVVQQTEDS